jgi:TRAP-type uncharacterized transport system substrate-binding protein
MRRRRVLPMRRKQRGHWLAWLVFVLLGVGTAGVWWLSQPARFVIAVGQSVFDEQKVVNALVEALARERAGIRLSVLLTDGPGASAQMLAERKADLAVVRSDIEVPRGVTSIIGLRRFYPVLITAEARGIKRINDLRGKRIGIGREPTQNQALAQGVLAHWALQAGDYTLVPLAANDIIDAVRSKQIDAFFSISAAGSRPTARLTELIREAWGPKLVLLPFDDVAAIAGKLRGIETGELVKGYFGGNPAQPDKDLDTIAVSNRIVVSERITNDMAVELTRKLLDLRDKRFSETPELLAIDAPTRTNPTLPVHLGTAAHLDGTHEKFFDRHATLMFLGLVMLGMLGSLFTALQSRLRARERRASLVSVQRVLALGDSIAASTDAHAIRTAVDEADQLLQDAILRFARAEIDANALMAVQTAVDRARRAAERWRAPPVEG